MLRSSKTAAFIGSILVLTACASNAQLQKKTTKPAAVATQRTANPIAKELKKQGIRGCLSRGTELAGAITNGSRFGVVIDSNPDQPDLHSATMVFSRQTNQPGMGTQLASVTLAPSSTGRCDATVDLVYLWGQPCQQIFRSRYAGYQRRAGLPGNVVVLQAKQTKAKAKTQEPIHQAYLMPLPNGCLVLEHNRS